MLLPVAGGSSTVVSLGELMMILELHRQGLTVSAIARQLGIDRKTVAKYIARGLEPPAYGPRPRAAGLRTAPTPRPGHGPLCPVSSRAPQRLPGADGRQAVAGVEGARLHGGPYGRQARGRDDQARRPLPIEVRFETPPGEQAQVDLARFEVEFTDEPGVKR